MIGYMYILECSDGSYYTGSTNDLDRRLAQHQAGEGANHAKKRLPVKLVYCEEYQRIDEAYYREKQVQGWNRKKKEALIKGEYDQLPELAIAYRDKKVASSASATGLSGASATGLSGTSATGLTGTSATSLTEASATVTTGTKAICSTLPEVLDGNIIQLPEANGVRDMTLPEALEGNDFRLPKATLA